MCCISLRDAVRVDLPLRCGPLDMGRCGPFRLSSIRCMSPELEIRRCVVGWGARVRSGHSGGSSPHIPLEAAFGLSRSCVPVARERNVLRHARDTRTACRHRGASGVPQRYPWVHANSSPSGVCEEVDTASDLAHSSICRDVSVDRYIHTYIHIHTSIHTYMHACVRACMHTCIHA